MFLSSFLLVSLLTASCIGCKIVLPMVALALACSRSLLPLLQYFLFFYYKFQPNSQLKVLKKELINIAFLDSLCNHIQSTGFSRLVARSIARPIAFPKICGLYKVPGLGAKISKIKCRKSYDNILSRDNLDTRVAIYIEWRYLALDL